MEAAKLQYFLPVRVSNGVPVCPCHDDPMVPDTEPYTWTCWLTKAAMDLLRDEEGSI